MSTFFRLLRRTLVAVRQLRTPKWLLTHALSLALVLLFVVLGWWQLHRAEGGNTRSYAYALEWPTFALLVIGFWAKIVRDELRPARHTDDVPPGEEPVRTGAKGRRDEDAEELAAYNRYVADRARQREQQP